MVAAKGLAIALGVAGFLLLSSLIAWPTAAEAHRDGCHRWHSCPSDTGSYVCGDTGNFSECGYTSLPEEKVYDDTAPKRPVVSQPKVQSGGKVAITVTAERGSTLVVRSGGKTIYKTTATGTKQVLSFVGRDGKHSYSVRATDNSDNASSVAKFKAAADAKVPSLEGVTLVSGTGNNARSRVVFTAGEAVKYSVLVDGQPLAVGTAAGDETEVDFPVADGRHRLVLKLTDAAGNVSSLKRTLNVDVAHLTPVVETLSEPNENAQRFKIVGTPGSRGTLTIAETTVAVNLESEAAEVAANLPDGTYSTGKLEIRDELGRVGVVDVPAFTVDTTSPLLKVIRSNRRADTGRLVARITAEEGARVVWQVEDQNGKMVERATLVGDGTAQIVDVDVEEGLATLNVEATDAAGNKSADDFTASIKSDPLALSDWLGVLAILGLAVGGGAIAWRKRESMKGWLAGRRHAADVRKARKAHHLNLQQHDRVLQQHAERMADYRERLSWWTVRRQHLVRLHDEAGSTHGAERGGLEILGVKAKKGERLYSVVAATLLEERSRGGSPELVDVEDGEMAVTSLRVVFRGPSKRREWAFDKVEQITDVDSNTTLIKVSNRKSLSGVRYDDPERTRLHLALAVNPGPSGRHQVVQNAAAALQRHADSRPTEPPPPPSPPQTPALLLSSQDIVSAARASAQRG